MTNEGKVTQIYNTAYKQCIEDGYPEIIATTCAIMCKTGAEIVAEWKDEQFKQEKQQLIEKACEWLNSRAEICEFLNPDKPVSVTTFNRNRAAGVYGAAIVGRGAKCKARKTDLLQAIQYYELNAIL